MPREIGRVIHPSVGGDVPCQQQDCKQLCKRIVYTFASGVKGVWKPNGAKRREASKRGARLIRSAQFGG